LVLGTAPHGEPEAGAKVLIRGDRGGGLPGLRHLAQADDQGNFRSDPLFPGAYFVSLGEAEGFPADATFGGLDRVLIHDRDVTEVDVGCVPGKGVLYGYLLSGDRAVVGARVKISCNLPIRDEPPSSFHYRASDEIAAVTGDEGEFIMLALLEGSYKLTFSLAGGRRIASDGIEIEPGARVEKVFHASEARVHGRLLDAGGGKPVAGRGSFCVFTRGLDLPRDRPFTKDRIAVGPTGRFEIPYLLRGDYTLVAGARGYGFEVVRISTEGSGVKSLDIPMHRTGVILAEVTSTAPFTASDLTFRFPMERCWIPLQGTAFKRDRRGRFLLDRAGPGKTEISCVLHGQELRERLWIGAGQTTTVRFHFDPPIEEPPIRVEGRVLSGGAPVVNCRVILLKDGWRPKIVSDPTDSEGNYALEVPEAGQYKAVLASSCGSGLPIPGGSMILILEGPFRLDLHTGYSVLSGTVVNPADGSPVAGAHVGWSGEASPGGWCRDTNGRILTMGSFQITDDRGRFHFPHVTHGEMRLSVFAVGFFDRWDRRQIEPLAPGENLDITVRIGEGGGGLKLILSGTLPSFEILKGWGRVGVGDYRFDISRMITLDPPGPGTLAFLGHGLPVGKKTISFHYQSRGGVFGGKAEAEIKAGEVTEVRIVVE
jgi:hypothetical protein